MRSNSGTVSLHRRFKFSSVLSAKEDRSFCSTADLRGFEDTSTVFNVYSKNMIFKFSEYVFGLCYLIAPEYSLRLLMNKLSYPNFVYFTMFEFLRVRNESPHSYWQTIVFLIHSNDEDTCFHQIARLNAVEAFFLLYDWRLFFMRKTVRWFVDSFYNNFSFSAVKIFLLIIDWFCSTPLIQTSLINWLELEYKPSTKESLCLFHDSYSLIRIAVDLLCLKFVFLVFLHIERC